MSQTAQSRDISDAQTVRTFADIVQSPERLKLLLLLTVADIRAVGPGIWERMGRVSSCARSITTPNLCWPVAVQGSPGKPGLARLRPGSERRSPHGRPMKSSASSNDMNRTTGSGPILTGKCSTQG